MESFFCCFSLLFFFPLFLSARVKSWHGFNPYQNPIFFLSLFYFSSLLFSIFCNSFFPPFLSSSNFFLPFSPAFLPFSFSYSFLSSSCFLFFPYLLLFFLSFLPFFYSISSSFSPPLSFSLFLFLFFLSHP